jgi:hypothetical protein
MLRRLWTWLARHADLIVSVSWRSDQERVEWTQGDTGIYRRWNWETWDKRW